MEIVDQESTSLAAPTSANQGNSWRKTLRAYERPDVRRSVFQLVSSLVPFFLIWGAMLFALEYSYWITLLLALPAAGFLVRIFILQHDCGHGSLFRSRRTNSTIGFFLGIMTLGPFAYWRRTHATHHETTGNLNHRNSGGDLDVLTVKEYRELTPFRRLLYRLYRNPIVLFSFGPIYQWVVKHRYPWDLPSSYKKEWWSVLWTNLGILAVILVMGQTIGVERFLLVQVPITLISGSIGMWLFYVQHQFENTYWEWEENWNYHEAAMKGSSYYVLPGILNWLSGSIGIHHIHHLSPSIPNYRLIKCYRENPEFHEVERLTLWSSLKCARLKLWDERSRRLLTFKQAESA